MSQIVLRFLVNVFVIYVASRFFRGIQLAAPAAALWAGLALTLVNLLVRPVLFLLTLPVNLLTLGLFTFVINAWMVLLASRLVDGFQITGFGPALLLVVIIHICNFFL